MENKSEIIIIGGGAAGLCAAITSAQKGSQVTLLEQNPTIGKKIRASGNGRCNITNAHPAPHRFHSQNQHFIESLITPQSQQEVETFLASIGVVLIEEKEGKCFPMSQEAASVVAQLEFTALALGVDIVCQSRVESIQKIESGFLVQTQHQRFKASKVLISAGSPAAPQLGGNTSGYAFAQRVGHALIPNHPALVQLVSEDPWVKVAAGVKCKATVSLYVDGLYTTQKEGDLLFTSYGVSGLAILDISRDVSHALAAFSFCELSIDLLPRLSKEKLVKLLEEQHKKCNPHTPLLLFLQAFLPRKLAKVILSYTKLPYETLEQLNRKGINRLVHTMKQFKISICDTKGFKGAEVASGGVDTTEIDPDTMASKKVDGLYFAGEVIDVDGDRGGFNFYFAWLSGLRAGRAMAS